MMSKRTLCRCAAFFFLPRVPCWRERIICLRGWLLRLVDNPMEENRFLENVKIFVPFIRFVTLTYRKRVIATNAFEQMREDCTSIVYHFCFQCVELRISQKN